MSLHFQCKSMKDNDVYCKKILFSNPKCSILCSQMPANVLKIIRDGQYPKPPKQRDIPFPKCSPSFMATSRLCLFH